VPPGSFPFVIRCPQCGAEADIAAVGYRMAVTPTVPLPDSWTAGQDMPGRRPTRQHLVE
jgi:hypothetical protein